MRGTCYLLVRIMVSLGVRNDWLVLVVPTILRAFLQRCKDFLLKIYERMKENGSFDWM